MSYLETQNATALLVKEPFFSNIAISTATALTCGSSSGVPALTMQEKRLRIAKAVYFCKLYGKEPTEYELKRLTGLGTVALRSPFVETKVIVNRYRNSTYPQLPTAYTVIWRRQNGVSKFTYTPTSFEFTKYEVLNGLNGYRIDPLNSFVIPDRKLKINAPAGSMVMLTAQLLKEYGLLHKLTGFNKAVQVAASTIKLLWATTLQDGRVYHNSHALKTLLFNDVNLRIIHKSEEPKCDGLFYRKDRTGTVGTGSFRYVLSRRGVTFMKVLVQRFLDLSFGDTKIDISPQDLLVSREDIVNPQMHTRDQVVLLSRCAGYRDGKLHIVNDVTDKQDSRVYGLMTMLTTDARTILGYHQYDMAAALQSIVFDVLDAKAPYDAAKRFPLHFRMVSDRKSFRQQIADEIGKDISWVKVALTKIDNGGSVHYLTLRKSDTLMAYKDEFRLFVDEFMKYADPELIVTAKRHAKIYNVDNEFVKKLIGKKYDADGRKIFGFFFFVWTQIERDIRELMKPFFKSYCHDIHDAIGSKEVVGVGLINQELKDAGFKYVRVELG